MRRLASNVPRGLPDHRTREGVKYRRYVGAWAARFGGDVPHDLRTPLRTAGRLMLEQLDLERDYDRARERRRLTEARRIRRALTSTRILLIRLEERLEARASEHAPDLQALRAVGRG